MLDYTFHITTPRLYISHLDPSNPAHTDYTHSSSTTSNPSTPPSLQTSQNLIQKNADRMATTGFGRYAISLRPTTPTRTSAPSFSPESCLPIGRVSMNLQRFPLSPLIPDIGFALQPAHHGKGYATEAAEALMQYYERERGQSAFLGFCHPENEASKGVFRRLGFEERGVRSVVGIVGEGACEAVIWTRGIGGGNEDLSACGL